jgi:ferrous iron transport protein B
MFRLNCQSIQSHRKPSIQSGLAKPGKDQKVITVALTGNPNTGKTSLFNTLTGLSLHVGNWPGKTVEKKQGRIRFQDKFINIVDLPGTYSIAPYSEEEKISRNFIVNQNPDVIIQIIDVNTLERHLLMTLELLALGKNIILAFNFNKEAKKRKIKIDVNKIRKELQIPIVQIEANTGKNKNELLKEVVKIHQDKLKIPNYLKALLKNRKEISHHQAVKFIKQKIGPFYLNQEQTCQTEKIDSILLNKYTAFPIFILVMFLMFKATFTLSIPLVNLVDGLFGKLGKLIGNLGLADCLTSFLVEGLIGGVGSILTFIPLIFILFFLITLLEDSGYLARTVALVDKLFHKFGISGRTFIPMILGFGCNVPAIMAVRTIKNKKEKQIAIFINSFMSCGARLPVYVLFTEIFFPNNTSWIIMSLYLFGMLTAFIVSFILSKLIKSQGKSGLIIELPPYRMPTFRNVLKHAWFQTSMFIKKAGSIILISVIVIWFLASLPLGIEYGSEFSLLGKIGKLISPIFKPTGFEHWTFSVALLFGLVAKEVVIGTLGTLHGVGQEGLMTVIPNYITPLGALALLFFVLLYIPCLATIAVIKKETGSWKFTFIQVTTTLIIAWIVSFSIYNIGLILGFK